MKKYRLFLSCLLVFSMVLSCATSSFAMNPTPTNKENNHLSEEERTTVEDRMVLNEVSGNLIEMEYLYNCDGDAAYILGRSENGYIILGREDYSFHEAGRLNPYVGYDDEKKYYGGVLCYYVDARDRVESSPLEVAPTSGIDAPVLYDIVRKEYTTEMITLEYRRNTDMELQTSASTRAVTDYAILPSYYMYIQRKAFGNNTDDTCSAVATGIALNYIARQYGISHANSIGLSENLTSVEVTDIGSVYPNANALHRYLDDTCGMGPISYGQQIINAVNVYENLRGGSPRINISFLVETTTDITTTIYNRVKQTINAGMPALMTTTFLPNEYYLHTMCVYGARTVDGEMQFNVHKGHYGSENITWVSGVAYQPDLWISAGYASYAYFFSF